MEHVIAIGPSGQVKSMHSDKFSLGFLGTQTIDRASDIRWDESKQQWGIWFNVNGTFCEPRMQYEGFDSYEAARDFEVGVMNECLREQMEPFNPAILRWAMAKR